MVDRRQRVRRTYVQGRFGQMHLWTAKPETTNHPALLCFHVSPLSGHSFADFIEQMGEDRLCIAPDTPGYGYSDEPDAPPDISGYAAAMSDLLDDLEIEQADVIGYATGSFLAAELARQRPDKIRRSVLFSAPVFDEADRAMLRDRFGDVIEPKSDGSHLIPLWHQVFDGRGPNQTVELCMFVYPDHIRAGDKKPWAPTAAFNCHLEKILEQLDQPVLVVNIKTEIHKPSTRAVQYLKRGKVVDLTDWGHGFLQTRTADTVSLVREFLDT